VVSKLSKRQIQTSRDLETELIKSLNKTIKIVVKLINPNILVKA
jgi:hypothetical protein